MMDEEAAPTASAARPRPGGARKRKAVHIRTASPQWEVTGSPSAASTRSLPTPAPAELTEEETEAAESPGLAEGLGHPWPRRHLCTLLSNRYERKTILEGDSFSPPPPPALVGGPLEA